MRICPKCSLEVATDAKICRVCGSILDVVVTPDPQEPVLAHQDLPDHTSHDTEVSSPPEPADEATEIGDIASHHWLCVTCGERSEHNFDFCWNCGTDKDGTEDPDFLKLKDVTGSRPIGQSPSESNRPSGPCAKCGSERVIPSVGIVDQGQYSDGGLKAEIIGNPCALFFRNQMFGKIRADICGQCGHLELRVENPEDLYEHYLESLG